MARAAQTRGPTLWAMSVVALATALTFARGLAGNLLMTWDDDRFIAEFPLIESYSLDHFVGLFTYPHFQAYHPLHVLSYAIDVPWAGPDPFVIHLVSLLLFVGALLAVLAALRSLGLPLFIATLATLAYGLHPIQVESVTWATGRKEILATLFASLSIVAHMRTGTWNDRHAWLARLFYLLAALSKTTALPLPGVLFLADVLLRDVPVRRALARQVPALLVGVGLSVVVVAVWDVNQMIRPDAGGNTLVGRVLLILATLTHHLAMAVFPVGNVPAYPIYRTASEVPLWGIPGALAFSAAVILCFRMKLRRGLFALTAFFVLLLPVLNLIPMYWHWHDRYLAMPLLPLAFGFGAALEALSARGGRRPLAHAVGTVAVLLLSVRTFMHIPVYMSDENLWTHNTRVAPRSYHGWLKLGETHRNAGHLDEAVEAFEHAVELVPSLRLGHGALFYSVALRDEARFLPSRPAPWDDVSWCYTGKMRPYDQLPAKADQLSSLEKTRAWQAARCYHASLDDPQRLRTLAGDLVVAGYHDAPLYALGRALALRPVEPERLERAARVQLEQKRPWLAEFYLRHLGRPPIDPALRALWAHMTGKASDP